MLVICSNFVNFHGMLVILSNFVDFHAFPTAIFDFRWMSMIFERLVISERC